MAKWLVTDLSVSWYLYDAQSFLCWVVLLIGFRCSLARTQASSCEFHGPCPPMQALALSIYRANSLFRRHFHV
ncbi:hypothetical protein EDC96DRAFT_570257 [Choanephora cucurbitarum]|nr:hypothetical protein EDC96DRAFT_570257 [Choanephora cucurbitarum]